MYPLSIPPTFETRKASLAPIYLAIACLVSVSAFGFAVASWPRGPGSSPHRPVTAETAAVTPSSGDVRPFPIDQRETRHKGKWT